MAWSEGAEAPAQHLADAIAAAFARAKQPGEHLAVHAPKLAVKPRLQILLRHRRSLLLCLEHPHRPAVEDHVNRAPRLGLHRSINLRIGIRCMNWRKPFANVLITFGLRAAAKLDTLTLIG